MYSYCTFKQLRKLKINNQNNDGTFKNKLCISGVLMVYRITVVYCVIELMLL